MKRVALAAALALLATSCECGGSDSVAELVSAHGTVERDFADRLEQWSGADPGALFAIGDGARTRTSATAELRVRGGGLLRLEEDTTVRFLRHPGAGAGLEVTTGEAVLEASDESLGLVTRFGEAQLEPRARVRLRAEGDGLSIAVLFGRAILEDETIEAGASRAFGVRFGDAVVDPPVDPGVDRVEDVPAPPVVAAAAEAPPTAPAATPIGPAGITVARRSGTGATVRLAEGGAPRAIEDEPIDVAPGARIAVPSRAAVVMRRGSVETVLEGRGEYLVPAEGGSLVRALSGGLEVTSGGDDAGGEVVIEVPGGSIVLRGDDARVRLDVLGRRGTEVRIETGRASIDGARDDETLAAGETAVLTPEGELTVGGRGPARADFAITAGASITVHDPRPPTALGVRFGELCTGRGVVELLRGATVSASSAGEGQANLLLASGTHVYRVRCLGTDVSATGTVRVVRDSGVEPLPPSAPRTVVDTDGRTYRVMYQTHLPDLTVRWPRPPASGPYVLTVRPASGAARTFSSSTPRVDVASGVLSTGIYRLSFAASGQTSRETTLEIRFDNAMPTASIRAPADGSFAPGESVRVAGIAVPGWTASVDGVALELDPQLRFEGTVNAPTNQGALAIELRHASRGRHVYVRRPRTEERAP